MIIKGEYIKSKIAATNIKGAIRPEYHAKKFARTAYPNGALNITFVYFIQNEFLQKKKKKCATFYIF